jgi:ubiquitin carboxyl-terminal hydrolase CYLD
VFGSIECLNIPGSVAPPVYGPHCLGPDRGIQGHHNSCYMDATLFSMFAFSTVFDAILHRPRSSGSDIERYDEVQSALRDGIVNPLRK